MFCWASYCGSDEARVRVQMIARDDPSQQRWTLEHKLDVFQFLLPLFVATQIFSQEVRGAKDPRRVGIELDHRRRGINSFGAHEIDSDRYPRDCHADRDYPPFVQSRVG